MNHPSAQYHLQFSVEAKHLRPLVACLLRVSEIDAALGVLARMLGEGIAPLFAYRTYTQIEGFCLFDPREQQVLSLCSGAVASLRMLLSVYHRQRDWAMYARCNLELAKLGDNSKRRIVIAAKAALESYLSSATDYGLVDEVILAASSAPESLNAVATLYERASWHEAVTLVRMNQASTGDSPIKHIHAALRSGLRCPDDGSVASSVVKFAFSLGGIDTPSMALQLFRLIQKSESSSNVSVVKATMCELSQELISSGNTPLIQRLILQTKSVPILAAVIGTMVSRRVPVASLFQILGRRIEPIQAAELYELLAISNTDSRTEYLLRAAHSYELAGVRNHADRVAADAESDIKMNVDLSARVPTSSTQLFRNPWLLCHSAAIIDAMTRKLDRPVRVHVGACSSGEEAISLAALLQKLGISDRVRLSASDVDSVLIQQARCAKIPIRRVRSIPEPLCEYFSQASQSVFSVARVLHESISFSTWNLVAESRPTDKYDLFMANNILIHLDDDYKSRLVGNLLSHITEDGCVCLGGDVHNCILEILFNAGWRALGDFAEEDYEGWHIQRNAWYVVPRPYWSLPPYRGRPGQSSFFSKIQLDGVVVRNTTLKLLQLFFSEH